MSALPAWIRPLLAPAGGLLVLFGERILPGSPFSPYLDGLGVLLLLAALLWCVIRATKRGAPPEERHMWWRAAAPYALFVASATLYFVALNFAAPYFAERGSAGDVDWAALAQWGWVLSLLAGVVLYVFLELALLAQRRVPRPDARRIGRAAAAGVSLALLLLLLVSLNFIFARLPWQWNLAYFKTTRPSEATREVLESLSEPLEVAAFFAADSPLAPLMRSYFHELTAGRAGGELLTVHLVDADLRPGMTEAFKARGNGWVVLRKGEVTALIHLGETLERARNQLRKFDGTFFSKLLEISAERLVVYMTVGHGERNEQPGGGRAAGRDFNQFRALLQARNLKVETLGLAEGLGDRIPDDAALVVVAGPQQPFLASELESLRRYLDSGGRLLAYLEPRLRPAAGRGAAAGGEGEFAELLRDYGIEFDPVVQANDRYYGRRTYSRADHALLVTIGYQSHASMNTLRRAANQFPLLLLGAGALRKGKVPDGFVVQETLKGMRGTCGDGNGNFVFDAGSERRGEPVLGLAVAPPEPRARKKAHPPTPPDQPRGPTILAFADVDMAADLLLQNRANRIVLQDAMAWLVRRETPVGYPQSEEDVRIRHARQDDWLWFYLPVIGVPGTVLLFGLYRAGRRWRKWGARID